MFHRADHSNRNKDAETTSARPVRLLPRTLILPHSRIGASTNRFKLPIYLSLPCSSTVRLDEDRSEIEFCPAMPTQTYHGFLPAPHVQFLLDEYGLSALQAHLRNELRARPITKF